MAKKDKKNAGKAFPAPAAASAGGGATAAGATAAPAGAPGMFEVPEAERKIFNEDLTEEAYAREVAAVSGNSFTKVGAYKPAAFTPETASAALSTRIADSAGELVAAYRARILGVDYSSIVSVLLAHLAASRKTGAYDVLFLDLVFGICAGYTVSRVTYDDYARLGELSALKQFEIEDRKKAQDDTIAKKNFWVEASNMNATAARMIGHLVVEAAPAGGFLAAVKRAKGTPFSPVTGGKDLERLMREAGAELTDADKAAKDAFLDAFKEVVKYMDKVWGAAGVSVSSALAAAKSVEGTVM